MDIIAAATTRLRSLSANRLFEPALAYVHAGGPVYLSQDAEAPEIKRNDGASNLVLCGHGAKTSGKTSRTRITFSGSNNLVFLGPHCNTAATQINVRGDNNIFYFGAFSTIVNATINLEGPAGTIAVGDECMLSARIVLSNSDGHAIYDAGSGDRINLHDDILIGNHVWLSRDVRVSKGAVIGNDAVIGQAALVLGNVADGDLCVGIPARTLRSGVTWSRMNAESLGAMTASSRHSKYLKTKEALRSRIASLA